MFLKKLVSWVCICRVFFCLVIFYFLRIKQFALSRVIVLSSWALLHCDDCLIIFYLPLRLLYLLFCSNCVFLGSFEVVHFWLLTWLLIVIIVAVLSVFSFKSLWNRFGLLQPSRREFYECGFKPITQKPVKFSIQFTMVCFFFLIYDIELAFSYPLVSAFGINSATEVSYFLFLYGTFFFSLLFDFDKSLTDWRI